ncbi:MAG: helix-hairpin-helix domain-containing protein [Candidatus Lokiarchaeota archaeon]|nr:helix-hairpin-helix domain-containing protein [Candidatus Lokiarchaeota archaeon]
MTEQNLLEKKQNHQDEKSDTINSSVSEKLLTPSIVKEGFTVIKGIGPSVAKKLTEAKIDSIEKLAHLSPNTLASSINGIGVASAQKIINGAKGHLSLKKLNDFSPSTEDDDNNEIESSKLEVYKETKDDDINKSHSNDLKGPQGRSNRWFEAKFKKLKTGTWYPPANLAPDVEIMTEELLEDEELIEIKDREELKLTRLESVRNFLESDTEVPLIKSIEKPRVDEIPIHLDEPADFIESMNHEQINNLKDNITTILESGEFHIITRLPSYITSFSHL